MQKPLNKIERKIQLNPDHPEAVTHAENTRRGEAVLFKKRTGDAT